MDNAALVRLLWAAGLVGAGVALYLVVNQLLLRRVHRHALGLAYVRRGARTIVYFTTPTCAPCKTIQRPALKSLQSQLGEALQVVEIDAAAHADEAGRWGVLSVPTTFILDDQGQPRFVNHGATTAQKLLDQIQQLR